jgi:hypothetical protein
MNLRILSNRTAGKWPTEDAVAIPATFVQVPWFLDTRPLPAKLRGATDLGHFGSPTR